MRAAGEMRVRALTRWVFATTAALVGLVILAIATAWRSCASPRTEALPLAIGTQVQVYVGDVPARGA